MKLLRPGLLTFGFATALVLPTLSTQASPESSIRLRPDHAGIEALRAKGPTVKGNKLAARAVDPGLSQKEPGLLERSTLLAFNGQWTMVPKRAVLHLPESFRSRVVTRPTGKLVSWRQFYAANRGWLHLQNVKLSDARGETLLSPEVIAAHRTLSRVVISVCEGGPISMPAPQQTQASL